MGENTHERLDARAGSVRYQTLRDDRLSEQRFKAIKGFVTNTIMLVLALALFGWHWRWLRRPAS
jgi:hypothetical protein